MSLVRTDAIPTPRCVDKTAPLGGDDRYGDPLFQYGPTRWAYGPTHYEMRPMTTTLIFKADQANKGHDPEACDHGH